MPLGQLFTTKRQLFSYITDYLIIFISCVAFGALDKANPHHQPFSLTDIQIQYPYADPERIPVIEAAVIAILFPLVVLVLWAFLAEGRLPLPEKRSMRTVDRLWELNLGVLSLGLSVGIALVATNALKNTVGRPRPDLLARCIVQAGSADATPFGLSTSAICTQTDASVLRDGFKSFPSGHSSVSFAGLGLLSLWLAGKLRLLDGRGQLWKIVLVMVPIFAAMLVAVTRIMDKRHHAFDVLFGSALGAVCAWVAYRQYFPSLTSSKAGIAFAPRQFGRERLPYGAALQAERGSSGGGGSRLGTAASRPQTAREVPLQQLGGSQSRGYAQVTDEHKHEDV